MANFNFLINKVDKMTVAADYSEINIDSTATSVNIPITWDYGNDLLNLFIVQQNLVSGITQNSAQGGFTFTKTQDGTTLTVEQFTSFAGDETRYTVSRNIPQTQDYSLTPQTQIDAEALEQQLDDNVRMVQDLSEEFAEHAITSIEPFEYPSKIVRANLSPKFDENGDLELSANITDTLPVVDTIALVKDPIDNTKQVRIDAEGVPTGTTAVITVTEDVDLNDLKNFNYVVGKPGSNANFTTIQAAVTAAEDAGIPAAILILPGQYTENVTIDKNGISLHGLSSWSNMTEIVGTVLIGETEAADVSLGELCITGSLVIAGTFETQVWVENVAIENTGNPAILLTNSNSASVLIGHKLRATVTDDTAPALNRASGSMGIDLDDSQFRRNGENGSNLVAIQMLSSGNVVLLRNTRVGGFINLSGSSVSFTISGASSQVVTTGTQACFKLTGFTGFCFALGINPAVGGGGVIVDPNPSPLFIFVDLMSDPGTLINDSIGSKLNIDGIKTINSGAGNLFLANDGIYKTPAGVGGDITQQVFTSSGTYTLPTSPAPASIKVICVAGGGAGGGCTTIDRAGSGGGGAGTSVLIIDAGSVGVTETITIGAGGAGDTGSGDNGGSSSFGAHCSATGGNGGTNNAGSGTGSSGGSGGAGTGGDYNRSGSAGGRGVADAASSFAGSGGSSQWGSGAGSFVTLAADLAGSDGSGFGAGGSGSAMSISGSEAGGSGTDGIIIVEEYY